MTVSFIIIAIITIASAIAAMTLRNLVHCALALVGAFAGLAALYLQLEAQFVGFAQILVYVGAVAILIVFAILLTGGAESPKQPIFSATWCIGAGVTLAVLGVLVWALRSSHVITDTLPPASQV
jgi:NADH-quinone oxidoreductase subunit J